MGCGCGRVERPTKTVYRVIYPDGSRSVDFPNDVDAHTERQRQGKGGRVESAQVPA